MKLHLRTLAAVIALSATGSASAGTVTVSFVSLDRYADAGTDSRDERSNLDTLDRHLQGLGSRLPPNQVLRVEVLDVDLAGTVLPSRRGGSLLRTVRGRADIPRLHLRYTLETDGQPVRRGYEWITDLNYARGLDTYRNSQPLYYEKRMLDTWFTERFTHGAGPGG
jgi:hypothetical protein